MHSVLSMAIAAVLLVLWVAFLFEGRREIYRTERLSYDFMFKWNVLPLLVALELLASSSLLVLALGVFTQTVVVALRRPPVHT